MANNGDLTCPAFDQRDDFQFLPDPVQFENTDIILNVHGSTPRFGKTSSMDDLLFGSSEEQTDYIEGLTAASILIAAFIIFWFILLIVFKCLGPNRVGFFSGKLYQPVWQRQEQLAAKQAARRSRYDNDRVELPVAQIYDNDNLQTASGGVAPAERQAVLQRQNRQLRNMRVVALCCSAGIVICAILMITMGVDSLSQASNNALDGIEEGQRLTDDATKIIDSFIEVSQDARADIQSFAQEINGICVEDGRDELCANLDQPELDVVCDFDFADIEIDLGSELETILNSRDTVVEDKLTSLRADIDEVSTLLADLRESADDYNWAFIVASSLAGLLLILCLLISYGIIEAWCGCSKNRKCLSKVFAILRNWLLLPIFIFLVIMSWLFSMVFVIGSTAASDMCVDSPDERLERALVKYGDFSSDSVTESAILAFLIYYIRGCQDQVPNAFLGEIDVVIESFQTAANFVDNVIENDILATACPTAATALAGASTDVFEGTLCNLAGELVEVQNFFSCENWRPLYRIVVYEGVCYNGNEGFYYVAITQFCIVIFAMIMLTVRAAFTEIGVEENNTEGDGLGSAAAAMASAPPGNHDIYDEQDERDHNNWTGSAPPPNETIGEQEEYHENWTGEPIRAQY